MGKEGTRAQMQNQLWSTYNLEDGEEPVEVLQEETELLAPDLETTATGSLLQWTTSIQPPAGSLSSDPTFHSTQIFQMAYSSPSTSIKSRTLLSSMSRTRPAPLVGHSLSRLILPGNKPISSLGLYPSLCQRDSLEGSKLGSSVDSSGTPLRRINSGLSTRETVSRRTSRANSLSPSM
nr:movement protein [Peach associated luteovirus]QMT58459.2 movement protein [Peach associated luteovirus]QMT58464.1 movement protein [Peach associated luteovirus]